MLRPFATLLVLVVAAQAAADPAADRRQLLFYAETSDSTVVASQGADRLFNPASVVKVTTSLWALERLGPDHRWVTTVGFRGVWDRGVGTIDGQLVVQGTGDPDFQAENAFLIARQLNELGIHSVKGDLVLTGPFTIGWEHGAERRLDEPAARARLMARRMRATLDTNRWDRSARASWQAVCHRRGWAVDDRPSIRIGGNATVSGNVECTPLVRHESNPLTSVLRRFNVYSNNDIIRIADGLGGTRALEAFTRELLGSPEVVLGSASGEGTNRMNARVAVRLMRQLHAWCSRAEVEASALLPLPGCDPGPVRRMFPSLARGARARTTTVKTGTLVNTDGGVAVLAGSFFSPDKGLVLFCVARPRAGGDIYRWRRAEQAWLLELMTAVGGAVQRGCGEALPFSDTLAQVEAVGVAEAEGK